MYNINGHRFGKLLVLGRDHTFGGAGNEVRWICECDCGKITSVRSYSLRKGNTTSCGCYGLSNLTHDPTTHGYHKTPAYHSWEKMKSRCNNPHNPSYGRYGGLGVSYAKEWEKFEPFLEAMGDRPEGMSLDRINPFLDYGPDNCRWADAKTQANNTRRKYISEGVTSPC